MPKKAADWTFSEVRDDTKKQSPYICDYDELTDERKETTRAAIRAIPRIFAMADYRVVQAAK